MLALLAIVGVGALGYYAYILSTETLTFPFIGMEDQRGSELQIIAARPSFLADPTEKLIDIEAARQSLFFGTSALLDTPSLSGEYVMNVSGEYIGVTMKNFKKGQSIRLASDVYNAKRTTKYRFGRDITLTPLEIPRSLDITSVGEPRDHAYTISMFGFDGYTPEHVRFYSYTNMDDIDCRVNDIPWHDAKLLRRETTAPLMKNGQIFTE